MEAFTGSLLPFLRKYRAESLLLAAALAITAVSFILFAGGDTDMQGLAPTHEPEKKQPPAQSARLMIEVSGAVNSPGVYEFPSSSRLNDVIKKAGGITEEADAAFFSRNFNLARYVADQEKILVPSSRDVASGIFGEREQIIDYRAPQSAPSLAESLTDEKIRINTSAKADLESLPGIGPSTADKIIQNRPYGSKEELISKKAVSQSVWEKIQDYIDL